MNDGASVVILASKEYAENNNLPYLATIKEVAQATPRYLQVEEKSPNIVGS
ncbi:hypothetical protein EfmAA242_11730 [Enterococcus faecium]|nr:hypothetical protein EfmAA242_11730 [Enterococcus faecium]